MNIKQIEKLVREQYLIIRGLKKIDMKGADIVNYEGHRNVQNHLYQFNVLHDLQNPKWEEYFAVVLDDKLYHSWRVSEDVIKARQYRAKQFCDELFKNNFLY